ncbi:MAG: DNA polymerase III subunit gamma/tau [Actinomycetota bacterium]
MGYVSLYRKWRPQTFEEVVGQDHIVQTLINAVKEKRVSHAYLFAGPRGTGKTSVAKILAKALNCQKDPTATPCNKCRLCYEITNGTSVDVVEIDAASNRGIDEIRDLREKVRFMPTVAGVKVYIIDEVHMLTPEAFNALLKMLEEPPAHVVFVLATTEPFKVLPTVLSRCQRFDFRRIGTADLVERLRRVAEKEQISIDESSLALIAKHSEGSMRDAISTLDQLSAYTDKRIKLDDVTSLLGMVEEELLLNMADAISVMDTAKTLRLVDEIVENGRDLRQFVRDLMRHFRDLFIVQNVNNPQGMVSVTPDGLERLRSQAGSFDHSRVVSIINALGDAYNSMRYSQDARLLLEVALVKMTKLELRSSTEDLVERIARLEARFENVSVRPGPTQRSAPTEKIEERTERASTEKPLTNVEQVSTDPMVDLQKVQRAWDVILKRLRGKKISTYALAFECWPVAVTEDTVILGFKARSDFHKKEVEKAPNIAVFEETLKEVLGAPLKIQCQLEGQETGGEVSTTPTEQESEKLGSRGTLPRSDQRDISTSAEKGNLSEEDVVKLVRDSFGARVVEEEEP